VLLWGVWRILYSSKVRWTRDWDMLVGTLRFPTPLSHKPCQFLWGATCGFFGGCKGYPWDLLCFIEDTQRKERVFISSGFRVQGSYLV